MQKEAAGGLRLERGSTRLVPSNRSTVCVCVCVYTHRVVLLTSSLRQHEMIAAWAAD